ncbi:sialate O-acetylesterase [Granulicella tundricola]|uniref:Sialate O-acetylesterase n=1 Tax=Granulicella tundricola (strain ATCC BAA-1859 / DSM 23138 / MP5ACTX9) TaxID=1198114 RepID=E8WX56_GRATM|nr:sialate O-acetylesterase [Granulicella tundricola]ADW69698.1 Sialate O-acetylesterase [Granulicella tundricola MP5ACTX9]
MKAVRVMMAGCLMFGCVAAKAELRLPKVISDHAVLQRERPIHVWGWATPGARVKAEFHAQTRYAEADALGRWSLYLQPEKAGGPYELRVSGDGGEATVRDLLVGDVWIASGQSNMEMPLQGFGPGTPIKDGEKEIAAATHPKMRLLLVEHKSSEYPLDDLSTTWTECTPETAKSFSAAAYFFGREISAKENVPVGLIDSSYGGTPADAWVSLDTLGTDASLLPAFASRATFANQQTDIRALIAEEKREDDAARAAGKPVPSHFWHPDEAPWRPAGLYNGMIAPLAPVTVKGFLWYQGEANSGYDRAPEYERLFGAMIGDWRRHFEQGNLPFLYAQISSYDSPKEYFSLVREEQRRVLEVANTGMVVTLDVGNAHNVHPADKQTVGARLALAARHVVYGQEVAYEGPLFREATTEMGKDGVKAMRVWFDAGKGLTFRGKAASGFELAGADHHFLLAEAEVEGESVVVRSQAVPLPVYVRYGWSSVVPESLYNAAGLPASTFSSEPVPSR